MSDGKKHRAYCFTLNNYTPEEEADLARTIQSAFDAKSITYAICGRERGDAGTPHLQGYVYFKSQKTLRATKSFLGLPRMHLEAARGTGEDNKVYCSKEGDFWEMGDVPSQGLRTDIAAYVGAIRDGAGLDQILDHFPEEFCKYHGAYDKLRLAAMPKRDWVMDVRWFYGPTGTGKSHCAYELGQAAVDYYCKSAGKWWDGYEGQEVVIMDEFRGDWMTFHELLRLTDKYQYQVEVKGGSRQFCSKMIIFTCPIRWDELFRGQTAEKLNQLQRRITETKYFPFRYVPLPSSELRGGQESVHTEHAAQYSNAMERVEAEKEHDQWADGFNPPVAETTVDESLFDDIFL